MWFKMSSELLHHPSIWCAARTRGRGDNHADARGYAIVRLLCASADGIVFADAAQMRACLLLGERTAQIVWDELISSGVLRQVDGGWSARAWMTEQGLFGETPRKPMKRTIPQQKPAERKDAERKDGVRWDWQTLFEASDDKR